MRRWPLVASFSVLTIVILLCFAVRRLDISTPPFWLPRCALYQLTGIHCPGCGNTRAAHALLNGDVSEAIRQNAFTVLALPVALLFGIPAWLNWVAPGRSWKSFMPPRSWHFVLVGGLLLLFTLLRNLPWEPFRWLAPDPPKVRESPASAATATPSRDAPPPAAR